MKENVPNPLPSKILLVILSSLTYNSYDVNLENLVLDQLIIP